MILIQNLRFYLSEHPAIVGFRWSHAHLWGSTWSFLFTSIAAYVGFSIFLHLLVNRLLFRCSHGPLPLGPLPALHSLSMALISATIFTGILLSSAAEIRDTHWFWRRTKTTPFQWLLCFPLVTRPNCQIVLLGCNLVCHAGVLLLHIIKGGCNGIGAWVFNSVLNGAILLLFLNFYVKMYLRKRSKIGLQTEDHHPITNVKEAENLEMVKDKDL